jgi:hypothetical protein
MYYNPRFAYPRQRHTTAPRRAFSQACAVSSQRLGMLNAVAMFRKQMRPVPIKVLVANSCRGGQNHGNRSADGVRPLLKSNPTKEEGRMLFEHRARLLHLALAVNGRAL